MNLIFKIVMNMQFCKHICILQYHFFMTICYNFTYLLVVLLWELQQVLWLESPPPPEREPGSGATETYTKKLYTIVAFIQFL